MQSRKVKQASASNPSSEQKEEQQQSRWKQMMTLSTNCVRCKKTKGGGGMSGRPSGGTVGAKWSAIIHTLPNSDYESAPHPNAFS